MDGFSETYWNAIQLLGWVYLGDREFVRRASDSVTDHGMFLQELRLPDGRNELVETPANPPELINLSLTAEWNRGAAYPSYADARDAVLSALQEDRLHAWGLENGEGDLKEVPAVQWAKLDFYQDKSHRIYAAPDDHFRPGATKWHGLKFERLEVLEIWPDPPENLPQVMTTQPLAPLSDGTLAAFLKRDTWTLTEALFLLNGNEPPGFETSDELMSHFEDDYILAVNSIKSGTLCREIQIAGQKRFIESPARWFAWALEKGLHIAETVRAKMAPGQRTDRRVLEDTYTTPMAVLLEEEPEVRDWFQAPMHTLEDCICYLMKKHRRLVTNRGDGHEDFDRFKTLALGFIQAGKLSAKKDDGIYWIERQNFIAWARKIDLGVFVQNLDELEAGLEPVDKVDSYRSGLAGRPTAAHLLLNELARRANEGKLESSLAAQARSLIDWLKNEHKDAPIPKPGSVENSIRERFRSLKEGTGPKPMK